VKLSPRSLRRAREHLMNASTHVTAIALGVDGAVVQDQAVKELQAALRILTRKKVK
jgi:hypothetical protein